MNKSKLYATLLFISGGGLANISVLFGAAYPQWTTKALLASGITMGVAGILVKLYGPPVPAMALDANAVVVPAGTQNVSDLQENQKIPISKLHPDTIPTAFTAGEPTP